MIWTARRRTTAIASLTLLAAGLVFANLIKHGLVTWTLLATRKDALAALSSAVSVVVLTVGGILAYFKFFRGRTFSVRADLDLAVDILAAPGGKHLHVLNLLVRNVGTTAIWDPRPKVIVYVNADWGKPHSIDRWEDALHSQDARHRSAVLDSGETSSFVAHETFEPTVWAVTYIAQVTCDSGDIWQRVTTVSNRPTKRDGAA